MLLLLLKRPDLPPLLVARKPLLLLVLRIYNSNSVNMLKASDEPKVT